MCQEEMVRLDLFLEVSEEAITLILKEKNETM